MLQSHLILTQAHWSYCIIARSVSLKTSWVDRYKHARRLSISKTATRDIRLINDSVQVNATGCGIMVRWCWQDTAKSQNLSGSAVESIQRLVAIKESRPTTPLNEHGILIGTVAGSVVQLIRCQVMVLGSQQPSAISQQAHATVIFSIRLRASASNLIHLHHSHVNLLSVH